jgi:putative ubiquitin-RnfH superfamily antitoxin RatB of RatAB toxin-antitoxin module
MTSPETIHIEVAYAKPEEQRVISLTIQIPCTAQQAIEQSGILIFFPEIDLSQNKIGIFSKPCALNIQLREGDRVEIYRPLLVDPKEIRRRRAMQQGRKKL